MAQIVIEPAVSSDDGFGFSPTHHDSSSATAFTGDDGDESHGFIRVALSADLTGVTIDSSFLTLDWDGAAGTLDFNVHIARGNDLAAPTTWSELNGLTRSTAAVQETIGSGVSGDQITDDLKAVIQEMVDNQNVANGDHMILIADPSAFTNTVAKEWATFDSTARTVPSLEINYTPKAVYPPFPRRQLTTLRM